MFHTTLALLTLVGGVADFDARVETLRFHLERLRAIEVPAALESEKHEKLSDLKHRLEQGADTEEAYNALYRAMDDVRMWLWDNALNRPRFEPPELVETSDAWSMKAENLAITLKKEDLALRVDTPSAMWEFAPCERRDIEFRGPSASLLDARKREVQAFHTGYSSGVAVSLSDFPSQPDFTLHLCINLTGMEMVAEVAAEETGRVLRAVNWPKPIELGNGPGDFSVIPFMQGMLLPGNYAKPIHQADLCNSRSLYMPWWGQMRGQDGVMTILETSDDAGGAYHHPEGGPTRIAPRWYGSMGQLRYLRSARYVFFDGDAGYVAMAKRYRRYVQETGTFVSLEEKLARTPALAEVIGRPVIHMGALYHFVPEAQLYNKDVIERNHALVTYSQLTEQLRGLKESGIEDAYVHLDGWGFYGYDNGHPDVLPPGQEQGGLEGLRDFADTCAELGYLVAVHDQYRDFYLNAVSFDERLALRDPKGNRPEHSVWCGGPQTVLNPRFAPGYVRRNHDFFAGNGVNVRGAYLDVFAVVPLEESYHPLHPVTRSDCARYRRDCFDLLRARGYVVSSEEPADYLVRSLDLVHHGPYPTLPNIGGGDAAGIPVPLFNLVYHDSILLPWSMTEDGGWGIPNGDAGRLHCLLNAGLPYVWPGANAEQVRRVNEAASLARHCGLLEMVNHEFLDGSYRKQRTTYSDGTAVTADFETKKYRIDMPENTAQPDKTGQNPS